MKHGVKTFLISHVGHIAAAALSLVVLVIHSAYMVMQETDTGVVSQNLILQINPSRSHILSVSK